jgi:hypothetical protein
MSPRSTSILAIIALILTGSPVLGCPHPIYFRILDHAKNADFIVHGRLENPRGEKATGCTDLVVESVVKFHPFLKEKAILTIPHYVPAPTDGTSLEVVVFAAMDRGRPSYFFMADGGPELARYVGGILEADRKGPDCVLEFAASRVTSENIHIANDVVLQLSLVSGDDLRRAARSMDPAPLRTIVSAKDRAPSVRGIAARLLGHCGEKKDFVLLHDLLGNREDQDKSFRRGVFVGLMLLSPNDGWPVLRETLKDEKVEFMDRHTAFRALARAYDDRPDRELRQWLTVGAELLLNQPDIADYGVEELRRLNAWESTARVLRLYDDPKSTPSTRGAVLRFALQAPGEQAKAFIEARRAAEPARVQSAEEVLRIIELDRSR